jgi:serine/threonine-protein kinase RsbT
MENNEVCVAINSAADIVTARQAGRALASELGFDGSDLTLIATAISEVARNIVTHAKTGEILLVPASHGNKRGIQVTARDEGPGIRDVTKAMQYGYSTLKGLGVGLPGAKWLMDEFDIATRVGKGTTVTMKKWLA